MQKRADRSHCCSRFRGLQLGSCLGSPPTAAGAPPRGAACRRTLPEHPAPVAVPGRRWLSPGAPVSVHTSLLVERCWAAPIALMSPAVLYAAKLRGQKNILARDKSAAHCSTYRETPSNLRPGLGEAKVRLMPAGAWSQSNDGRDRHSTPTLPQTCCDLNQMPAVSATNLILRLLQLCTGPVSPTRRHRSQQQDTQQRNAALRLRKARLPLGALPEHASPLPSLPKLGALPKTGFKELFIQTACVPIAPVFSPPQKLQGKPRATAFFPQGKQRIN